MPKGMGYPAPKQPTPKQNAEGKRVAQGQQDVTDYDALTAAGINAKKTSPYGPQMPGLAHYFRKM